jgi:hypothetical protein
MISAEVGQLSPAHRTTPTLRPAALQYPAMGSQRTFVAPRPIRRYARGIAGDVSGFDRL